MSVRQAELALRRLQQIDEVAALSPSQRVWLVEAETALGELLNLKCTGVDGGEGFFNHNGDTCPIHEWFDLADAQEAHE